MDEYIFAYRKLINLIDDEEQLAVRCFQGDILEIYKNILKIEREKIENQLKIIKQKER